MHKTWSSAGWIALWTTAIVSVLTNGCGRSTGFEIAGQAGGLIDGSAGSNAGSGGQSGSAGSNGTAGSNGVAQGSSGSGTGSPGTGTSAGSITTGGTGGCVSGSVDALGPCSTDSDCMCGFQCVSDTGGSICEKICVTTGDCPNLETLCVNGTCAPNFCGAHGTGPQNGNLDGTCNALGVNDGSCIPQSFNDAGVGLCSQAGPAQTTCDPLATRDEVSEACIAGDVCLLQAGQGQCFTMCDHDKRGACGTGMVCVIPLSSNPRLGICEPSSASTGGTATGGATTGGTDGGCSESAPLIEFQPCASTAGCGCPLVCNDDPLQSTTGSVCEWPCGTGACSDPVTICSDGGICVTDGCGGDTGNGSFDSTCNVNGVDDGTCVPDLLGDVSVGYCVLAGGAPYDAGACDLNATSSDTAGLCPPGSLCAGAGSSGACFTLCDPSSGTGCPSGSFCSGIVDEPDLGVCLADFGQ